MPTALVVDNDLDYAYKAKILKALIGADTAASLATAPAGSLAYESTNNYFHAQRGATAATVKRIPWEDGTPADKFFFNRDAATLADRVGLWAGANAITVVENDGTTQGDFEAAAAYFSNSVGSPTGSFRDILFNNPAGTFAVTYKAPALAANYTRTMPLALPASGTRFVAIDSTGQESFVANPGIPTYANDAARVTAAHVGLWQNAAGQIFYSAAATAGAVMYFNENNGEIVQQTAPGTPTTGDIWRDGELMRYRGATTTYTLATLADVTGMMRFRGIYNVPATPATAAPHSNAVTNIRAGDMWIIGTGGTITGISGDDVLASGDFLVATVDAPSANAGYGGIEMNQQINLTTYLAFENQNVSPAGTAAVTATYTVLTTIRGCEAYDSTGVKKPTIYTRIASGTTITVDSVNAYTNLRVLAYGTI